MLATAGHVIQELDTLIADPGVHIEGACLLDGWSIGAVNHDPIPFDLVGAPRVFIHDDADGLDFGFIRIRPYYQRLLETNGIEAVDEQRWRNLHQVRFSHYGVLGIPEERVTKNLRTAGGETQVSSTADPFYIPVTWVDDAPDEFLNTTCPRFIGRLPDVLPIESVVGMSGGPIFGFWVENGSTKYCILAIQSAWRKDHRIIFGCLLPYIGALVERELKHGGRGEEE